MRNGLALMGFLFILYLLLLSASEGACDTGNTFSPPTIWQFGNNMVLLQYKITVRDKIMAESAITCRIRAYRITLWKNWKKKSRRTCTGS